VNRVLEQASAFLSTGRHAAREQGAGVAVSLLLHGLLLLLVLTTLQQHTAKTALSGDRQPAVVPVDLVRLGDETRSPPADLHALVPQQRAGRPQEAASPENRAVSAEGKKPAPVDAVEAKLRALARLKQPDSPLKLDVGQGVSDIDAANGAPGDAATYSIRDYVLAQVLRRWLPNLARAKLRPAVIAIRVTMKRDGSIASAEIVELAKSKTDAAFRDLAIGARNAVLLSSPIALPPGSYPKEMHFTLNLDTRAVIH
jgi:hypothetical protein